jgi:hypothetical protein
VRAGEAGRELSPPDSAAGAEPLPGLWDEGQEAEPLAAARERFVAHLTSLLPRECRRILLVTPHPALAAALAARGLEVGELRGGETGASGDPALRGGPASGEGSPSARDGEADSGWDVALVVDGLAALPRSLPPLLADLRRRLAEQGRLILAGPTTPAGDEGEPDAAAHPVVALSEAGFVILRHDRLDARVAPARRRHEAGSGDDRSDGPAEPGSPSSRMGYQLLVARRDAYHVRAYRDGDEAQILPIFEGSFFVHRSRERWSWEYRENPYGNEIISEAFAGDGQLVAHYAGYPVRFHDRGEPLPLPALQVGDTFTLPAVRHVGRGPTSLLGRTVRHFYARFCERRVAFNYGFNTGNIQRFSLAFVGARRVEDIPFLELSLPAGAARSPGRLRALLGGWRAARVETFDRRWDELFARAAPAYGMLVERDARYLDWRYRRCPDGGYVTTAAFRRGELAGWGVFQRRGDRLRWGDALLDPAAPEAAAIVLAKALELPEHQGVTLVETWGTSRPPWWRALLVELGFVERPEPAGLGMVFVPFAVDPTEAFRDRLYYTMGDSDLF